MNNNNKLLVVDDEVEICDLLAQVAASCGYEVKTTTRADAFRRLLKDWEPTHIALDLNMPDSDGVELIRYLSQLGSRARIIISSGVDMSVLESVERLARERGLSVIGALAKPVDTHALIRILQQARDDSDWVTPDEISRAVADGDLSMVFQPKVSLADGSVVGFEALARWDHPHRGPVSPGLFVPVAEAAGIMDEMTAAVLGQTLDQVAEWGGAGRNISIAVNISPTNLHDVAFADRVLGLCADRKVRPGQLTLELTETATTMHAVEAMDILTRLRLKGVHLSIDDFGTGYSSLAQLQRLPFTEIKLDRAFVSESVASSSNRTIVRTIIHLARNLGMTAVAEGVEDVETLRLLAEEGSHYVQGYFVSRPLAASRVLDWLEAWDPAALLAMLQGNAAG